MLPFLLACAASAPEAPPAPAGPDLTPFTGTERACIERRCATALDAASLAACRAESCVETPATWGVDPTLVRYDAGTLTMSVSIAHTPGAFGDVPVPTDDETFLGATVLTKSGEEIDMAVHTVFSDRLGESFTFSSEVGPDVELVIVGLWGKKIEPCDSTRSGCKMFGFVLDESLAAYPAETYASTAPRRQRLLPAKMSVATALPATEGPVADAVTAALAAQSSRFGTAFDRTDRAAKAAPPPSGVVVLHRDANDGPLATQVGEAVAAAAGGVPVQACHVPKAAADLVIDLVAPPPEGAACR